MKFGEKIEQYFSFQASTKSVIPQVTKTQLEIAAGKGDLTQVKSLVDHADFKEKMVKMRFTWLRIAGNWRLYNIY